MLKGPIRRSLVAFLLATAAFSADAQTGSEGDLVHRVAQNLGFGDKDRDRVRAGGIAARAQPEEENELAAALAMIVQSPVEAIYEAVEGNAIFRVGHTTLEAHPVDPADPSSALGALKLPGDQIEDLHNASPGSTLNLSSAEIDLLRGAAEGEVLPVFRTLLALRVAAYQSGGPAAIAPYARAGKKASPGGELKGALERLTILPEVAPEFWRAITEFPIAPSQNVEHQFWWRLLEVEGKPTPVLSHRVFERFPDHAIFAERQFYVTRSYNSLQIVVGVFALDPKKSLVLYTNRTFTDQVAGFGSSARHRIGRSMLIDEVRTFFEAMREELEAPRAP